MLAQYLTDTANLLQNPGAPASLYTTPNLTRYINVARGQLAGEAECIRFLATLSTVANQQTYDFSDLQHGNPVLNGIAGVIHIRSINVTLGSGQQFLSPRAYEWFNLYYLNDPAPVPALPTDWAQYGQGADNATSGSTATGSFVVHPIPDDVYTLNCDCVCYPIPLTDDTVPEAIPYLWTDAVPFFAAYYALLSSQTSARQADAERMFEHYQTFVQRARQASNPSVDRQLYSQATDPTQLARIGLKQGAA